MPTLPLRRSRHQKAKRSWCRIEHPLDDAVPQRIGGQVQVNADAAVAPPTIEDCLLGEWLLHPGLELATQRRRAQHRARYECDELC
jgi:hypothetical protein